MQEILEIIDLDDNARGIAKKDGIIYFVENAILGEVLLAKIIKNKKKFIEAIKIKTLKESPYIFNDVNKNDLCGIYDLFNLNYDVQVKFKKNKVLNIINRISKENLEDIEFIEANQKYYYRNKVELKLSNEKIPKLSYFSRKSNDFISIDKCVMNTYEINEVIKSLKVLLEKYKIPGYNPKTNRGVIKNIIIRSTSLGEIMMIIVFNEDYNFNLFFKELEKLNILDSFFVSRNTKIRDYKVKNLVHVFGKRKIREKLGDFIFNISPKAFMQINKEISFKIYMKARDFIKNINPNLILDLYSGISTTSILLSDLANKIISIEINEDSVLDAKENAYLNNIHNIEWINSPAEIAIEDIDIPKDTVLLVDPPRRGLEENIINKIGKSDISYVIYISCNPATLARDIKRFKDYNFKIIDIKVYDQFVHTIDVETIALIQKM